MPTTAITITAPALDASWDFSQTNTIEWTSVSTDPANFSIVLVNNQPASGPELTTMADLVNTSDQKYSFTNFVTTPGPDHVIRFVGVGASDSGVLAESQEFNITKSGTAAPNTTTSTTSGPSPTGTSAPASTSAKGSGAGALAAGAGLAGSVAAALCMLL